MAPRSSQTPTSTPTRSSQPQAHTQIQYILSVLSCATVELNFDWEQVAVDHGIGYARNASSKFKNICSQHGYRFENKKVSKLDCDGDGNENGYYAKNIPPTPKVVKQSGIQTARTKAGSALSSVGVKQSREVVGTTKQKRPQQSQQQSSFKRRKIDDVASDASEEDGSESEYDESNDSNGNRKTIQIEPNGQGCETDKNGPRKFSHSDTVVVIGSDDDSHSDQQESGSITRDEICD